MHWEYLCKEGAIVSRSWDKTSLDRRKVWLSDTSSLFGEWVGLERMY